MYPELNKEYDKFEAYLTDKKGVNYLSLWYPEEYRYTVQSIKQAMWEVWLAARGYKYKVEYTMSGRDTVVAQGKLW